MKDRTEYYRSYRQSHATEIAAKRSGKQRKPASRQSKWARRSIVAWDGEGCNFGDQQLYVLLANSRGDSIVNRGGLTTMQCLDFLCDHARKEDINVIFGGSYDANMMIADLPRRNLEELWKEGHTRFGPFYIRYQWRKCFMVSRNDGGGCTLWDVLGFFQKKFVDTVADWLPEFDTSAMAAMKDARPSFDLRNLPEIIAYNADECRVLVQVCEALFEAFDIAGITLNRYDGAGAIAASLMRMNGVQEMKGQHPPEVRLAAQHAYAGGLIEACMTGSMLEPHDWEGDRQIGVERADINSAYPTFIRDLPCTAHGAWRHWSESEWSSDVHQATKDKITWEEIDDDPSAFTIWHVKWSFRNEQPFYPLFYRNEAGGILFPRDGEGWYWTPEIAAIPKALRKDIEHVERWAYESHCDHRPFAFVDELYDKRAHFKALLAAGDPAGRAEVPIKLGLNSLYGKMAQQVGSTGKAPTYHDLCWAGFVTASVRALMHRTAWPIRHDVIAFATDAIIARVPVPGIQHGKALGEWSVDHFDGIVLVQAGVYFLREHGQPWATIDDEKLAKEAKYRGFDKGTLVRDAICDVWKMGCTQTELTQRDKDGNVFIGPCPRLGEHDHYHATCTRFIGTGSALASAQWWHRWRTWQTESRTLSLLPAGKRWPDPRVRIETYAQRLVPTLPAVNHTPDVVSCAYPLSWEDGASSLIRDTIEGVDVDIVEKEWSDSYE